MEKMWIHIFIDGPWAWCARIAYVVCHILNWTALPAIQYGCKYEHTLFDVSALISIERHTHHTLAHTHLFHRPCKRTKRKTEAKFTVCFSFFCSHFAYSTTFHFLAINLTHRWNVDEHKIPDHMQKQFEIVVCLCIKIESSSQKRKKKLKRSDFKTNWNVRYHFTNCPIHDDDDDINDDYSTQTHNHSTEYLTYAAAAAAVVVAFFALIIIVVLPISMIWIGSIVCCPVWMCLHCVFGVPDFAIK